MAYVARFSREIPGHLAVGKFNGDVDFLTLTRNPFSANFLDTYDAQGGDATAAVTDMDFNYGNTKLVTCGTNDDDVIAIAGWATPGSRSTQWREPDGGGNDLLNCKWSKNDDVVVSTQLNNIYIYSYPASGGVGGFTSRLSASGTFTDLAVRPDTATPIKVLVSGGNNPQGSAYFFNSGGAQSSTPNIFSNTTPTAAINTACYGGDSI